MHNSQHMRHWLCRNGIKNTDELNIKLADFGLATKIEFIGDRKHTICGTPNYIAPEVIKASLGKGASGHSY